MSTGHATASAAPVPVPTSHKPHTCPPWIAWFLASPLRRLFDDPERTLSPLIQPGDTVLEVGPGYGFYTLPAARLVGDGRVICVDVQQRMLDEILRRARRRGLASQIEVRRVADGALDDDLTERMNLVLAINVVHESRDPARLMTNMARTLRPGGRLLLMEPRNHCPDDLFRAELGWGRAQGLTVEQQGTTRMSVTAILTR